MVRVFYSSVFHLVFFYHCVVKKSPIMKRLLRLLFLVILLKPMACAQVPNTGSGTEYFTHYEQKADALLKECITYKESVGLVAGVSKNGKFRWKGAAGYLDLEKKIPANPQMLHRIASIAKPMTAIAILQLYEQGKLDLEAPIQTYLPYFPKKEAGTILIKYLLNHTSGIAAYASYDESAPTIAVGNLKEAIAIFKDRPLRHQPGKAYSYTTYGYVLLGAVVEEISGMSFRDYMHQNIWRKAGMKNTDVEIFDKNYPNKSKLYFKNEYGGLVPDKITNLSSKVPGGGFYSTVEDLLKFGDAILQHKLIKATTFKKMIANPGIKTSGNPYGMGWFIYGDADGANGRVIGHTGSQSGTSTYFQIYLDQKIVVAVLSNTSETNNEVIDVTNRLMKNALDPAEAKQPLPTINNLPDQVLSEYLGAFEKNGRVVRVFKENDHLFATINNRFKSRLYPMGKDRFFIRWNDIQYAFFRNENQEIGGLEIIELGNHAAYTKVLKKPSLAQQIAEVLQKEGITTALKYLEAAYAADYHLDTEALIAFGEGLIDSGQTKEAILFLEKLAEKRPDVLEIYEVLAKAELSAGNQKTARVLFIKAAALRAGDGFYQMSINPPSAYQPTVIPKNPKSLFEYRGDLEAKDVFIFLQGGPDPFLSIDNQRDPFYALSNRVDRLRVYPYQSQMLNHSICSPKSSINPEAAAFERRQSAEILYQTIQFFKKQGKRVHVFAHSFGSQLTLEYLESKPNIADHIILMGGKLDNNIANYPDLPPGQLIRWRRGLEPFVATWHNSYGAMPLIEEDFYQVINNVKALVTVHRKKRFTHLLKSKKLDNVIFVHAKFDEASGRQTPEELAFLRSKGATTIGTYGDHHSMLSRAYMSNLYDSIINNKAVRPSLAYTLSNQIGTYGMEAALEWFQAIDLVDYFVDETELNTLGYDLVGNQQLVSAIEIFKINVAAFPNSWNVYDSLGETYRSIGNKALAILNYEKSMQINPGNPYGKAALLELKK